ncbi:MAG: DUF3575 domain-containing protein [Bdellovibrionales bacterium]|nr:DUF3575 domain-containing protein [Bdellovibrionales bacterium]
MKRSNLYFVLGVVVMLGVARGYAMESEGGGAKGVNIRVNPLGLVLGSLSGDVDFRVSDKVTLGPSIGYLAANFLFAELTGVGIGVRANYYLTGDAMNTGWYVGPSAGLSIVSVRALGSQGSQAGMYIGSVIGRQWVWENGLNVNLALGASWYSNGDTIRADNGGTISVPFYYGFQPSGEISLGYAF